MIKRKTLLSVGSLIPVMNALLISCSSASRTLPPPAVGAVTTFSLGKAHIKRLAKSPSAGELYSAVWALYDSFSSAAWALDYKGVDGGSGALGSKPSVDKLHGECRYSKPHKQLMVFTKSGKLSSLDVINGVQQGSYWAARNEWQKFECVAVPKDSFILGNFWLTDPNVYKPQLETSRLPDTAIRGTPVYVLQLNWTGGFHPEGGKSDGSRTVQLYLGKKDLLPRRMIVTLKLGSDAKNGTFLCKWIYDYLGFRADVDIPDSLFSTTPPNGVKVLDTAKSERS